MSRVGRPRTQPERRHHRQSKRQERRKRGAWIDRTADDAGKKIKGKKRHILVDTQGLLLHALVHSADIQDRDGGVLVMATLFGLHPFLLKLYADGGYQGPIFQSALREILRQIDVAADRRTLRYRKGLYRSCPSDGSSNAPSRGSTAAAAWPRIGSASTERPWRSCAWPLSASCCEKALSKKSMIPDRTLRGRRASAEIRLGSRSVEPYFQFIIDCVIRISGN